jgi:hypothetical protein
MKLAGDASGMDLLRVQAFLGLLLGTLTPPDTPDTPGTPEDPAAPPDGQPPAGPGPGDAPSPAGSSLLDDPARPAAPSPGDAASPGPSPSPGTPTESGTPTEPDLPAEPDLPQFRDSLPSAGGQPLSWPAVLPHLPWPVPADGTPPAPAGLLNLAVPAATLTGTSATTVGVHPHV